MNTGGANRTKPPPPDANASLIKPSEMNYGSVGLRTITAAITEPELQAGDGSEQRRQETGLGAGLRGEHCPLIGPVVSTVLTNCSDLIQISTRNHQILNPGVDEVLHRLDAAN